jgi:hypothetical protein
MHAYLLIGNRKLEEKIKDLIEKGEKSIYFDLQKIDDVRNLQSLTKYQGGGERFFVIKNFQKASVEAMNAFLKLLEEPGENIKFILCAKSDKNILETIISRCKVIRLGHKADSGSISSAKKFFNAKLFEKLKILHNLSKKDESLKFLSNLIDGGHFLLIKNVDKNKRIGKTIDSALKTKNEIKQNANATMALTKFALDLV